MAARVADRPTYHRGDRWTSGNTAGATLCSYQFRYYQLLLAVTLFICFKLQAEISYVFQCIFRFNLQYKILRIKKYIYVLSEERRSINGNMAVAVGVKEWQMAKC